MSTHPTPVDEDGDGTGPLQQTATDPRLEVELITRSGDFVAKVKIPWFAVMPEMLLWGDRYFFADTQHANQPWLPSRYREGMVWVVQN